MTDTDHPLHEAATAFGPHEFVPCQAAGTEDARIHCGVCGLQLDDGRAEHLGSESSGFSAVDLGPYIEAASDAVSRLAALYQRPTAPSNDERPLIDPSYPAAGRVPADATSPEPETTHKVTADGALHIEHTDGALRWVFHIDRDAALITLPLLEEYLGDDAPRPVNVMPFSIDHDEVRYTRGRGWETTEDGGLIVSDATGKFIAQWAPHTWASVDRAIPEDKQESE